MASRTTAANGSFSLAPIAPGRYEVEAAMPLFESARVLIDVPQGGEVPPLRLVMDVAGLVESMVVTGRRTETRLAETPQKIELIDRRDIERSVAADITDVLKKNSGVEVVQYSGVLSGIGIRGFRPETSGLNKRSLLLIDGRPSGVTNLSTLMLDGVERIEVLKGPASSIYGASAMGGVVNVITRRSRGPVTGGGRIAFGRYNTSELGGHAGGSLGPRVDFDVSGTAFNQRDDFRMGNGVVRPATSYQYLRRLGARGTRSGERVACGRARQHVSGQGHQHAWRRVCRPDVAGTQGSRTHRRRPARVWTARPSSPVRHVLHRRRTEPHAQRHHDQPARPAVPAVPDVRKRARLERRPGPRRVELVRAPAAC